MPSPYVKNLVKDTGKSVSEIEKLWDRAKKISAEEFGKGEDSWGSREYSYTVGIVKNMLGIREELLDPQDFLNSDLVALDFLKEVTVSGQFDVGNVVPPDDEKEEEEEEEELDEKKKDPEDDEDDEKKKQLLQDLEAAEKLELSGNERQSIEEALKASDENLSEEEQVAIIDQVLALE